MEDIRRVVGGGLSEDEVRVLAEAYAALSRGVAAFPADELKTVEPPLVSTPAPRKPASRS